MHKAFAIVLASVGAVSLTSAVVAAGRNTHVMYVPLSDGSVAKIEYVGDVPPKVALAPPAFGAQMISFDIFGRTAVDMQRQINAMMRQIGTAAVNPVAGTPGMNVAAYGSAPAGSRSMTVVSTSNGGRSCTRSTEVVAAGPGKPPKVTTNVSGDCGSTPAVPPPPPTPVTRT